jgi:hypothetical protein
MYGIFLLLSVWIVVLQAHPYYRDQIPNGWSVPNPCGGGIWEAVGHYDPHHHTVLKNPFAQVQTKMALICAIYSFIEILVEIVSNGDGKSLLCYCHGVRYA